MENTRRSFLKKVSAAGIGAAGLAMAGNAGATTTAAEPQKKKAAGKEIHIYNLHWAYIKMIWRK